ncbi:MAG: hypothetical protein Q8906_12940 [Bacillota bacterium]|nr:hypothetical protein [Bacillota bacterium]
MKRNRAFLVVCALSFFVIMSACSKSSIASTSNNKSHTENASQSKNDSPNNSSSGVSATKNNRNQNNKDSKSSNKSTTISNKSAGKQFDNTIVQAMQYAQIRSNISLMAPTKPFFTPNVKHMGAKVSADKKSYSVDLFSTDKPLPINSSLFSSRQYDEMNNLIGGFGGSNYSSPKIAKAQLYQTTANDLSPPYQSPPNSPFTKVDLGKGITGTAYASFPMVEWHEGKWIFQVWDGTLQQDVLETKKIVAYLDTHLLPPTYGVFGENIAGDGNHTGVEWVYGNTVYSCFSYHSGLLAAEMAVSTRVYPSLQTKP